MSVVKLKEKLNENVKIEIKEKVKVMREALLLKNIEVNAGVKVYKVKIR